MRLSALALLMRAELRGRRLRAMLLFIVVIALASAALVGGLEGQNKADDRWNAAFTEANGAHVTIDGRDPDTLAEIAHLPEVAASTRSYRRSADDLEVLRNGQTLTTAFVREMEVNDRPEIARPLVRDGRWANPGTEDEIVIDRAFGLDEGIDVDDQIAISTPAGLRSFTVVGRAVDFVDCFYPNCDPVTAWVDPVGFARLGVEASSTVFLRLREPEADDQFIASLNDYNVGTQGWIDTRDDTLSVYKIFGAFLGAFGLFVMIAAAVVVAGSMATRAVARRRDIGLLKAVGTTPRQVAASIVVSHVVAAAVGVGAGWVLGGFLAPATEVDLGKTLGTGGASFSLQGLLVALVIVELIVIVATVVPAWRASRLPTTAALAPVTIHAARGRLLTGVTARLRMGPIGVAGVRDAFGRPARSALTAIALSLAIVAALTSISTQRTVDRVFGDPTLVGNPEELRVYPTGDDPEAIRAVLDRDERVASWFTETPEDLALGDETFLGVAMSGDVDHAGFDVREGRMLAGSGEAVAGWGLLNRLGLDVGDEVTISASGEPIRLAIVGWYRESEDTGEILRFSLADLQRVRLDVEPGWVSINLAEGVSREAMPTTLTDQLSSLGRVEVQYTEGSAEVDAFRLAFLLVSLLVIIVAVANLASTMLLSVRQRTHDLGVLRAVGATPRQVVATIAASAAALAAAAAMIGVPLGLIISNAVAAVVGSASGIGPGLGAGPGISRGHARATHCRFRCDPRCRCCAPRGRGRGVGPGALRMMVRPTS
jgi:putative ABC transport system permease protein